LTNTKFVTKGKVLLYEYLNNIVLESNKQIRFNFEGGDLSSDAGLLLIKEFAHKIGFNKIVRQQFKTKDSEPGTSISGNRGTTVLLQSSLRTQGKAAGMQHNSFIMGKKSSIL